MKHYVYGHFTSEGLLYYIGKGSGDRYKTIDRNYYHDKIASEKGCYPKILFDKLSFDEAIILEKEMIKSANKNNFILTNSNMFLSQPSLSNKLALDLVYNIVFRKKQTQSILLTSKEKTSIKVDKVRSNYLKSIKYLTDFDTIDELIQDMIDNYLTKFDDDDIDKIHMFKNNLDKRIKDI